jgi:hypothetical protein
VRISQPTVNAGQYVRGEKQPPLTYQFQDANGTGIDLSGYTAAFVVRTPAGVATTYTASVLVGTDGYVSYPWTGSEWPEPGPYTAEFWAGNGAVRLASIRIAFTVREPVGEVPPV